MLCLNCQIEFFPPKGEVKRGNGKFCSHSCCSAYYGKRRISNRKNNAFCAYCQVSFYKPRRKTSTSKSGLFFCCREHKDLAQRIGGIKEIQPPHYNNHISTYRSLAFRHLHNKCSRCEYSKHLEILEVHHIDCDRTNNTIENLEILCPTCHDEIHFLSQTGKWGKIN